MDPQFENRKREHIQQSLNPLNQSTGLSGLDDVRLAHEALPELNFEDLTIESECLGKPSHTPFFVCGMTAGHADAPTLNRLIAASCQNRGWAMGVGSQRRDFEVLRGKSAAGYHSVDHWKSFRTDFPRLTLLGNLGISQLIDASIDDVRKLVDLIEASALCVHVNAMQEAIQPEGTPHFRGALKALETLCAKLGVPVVLKETGCGFSSNTLVRLKNVGLAAIDVSGLGGTHWGRIEGSRAESGSLQQRAAVTFGNWGETTVDSVVAAKNVLGSGGAGGTEIWASGGVRSGLDAAKLIALGSKQVGYAQPVLKAALGGEAVLDSWMKQMEFELKVALFCTGSSSPTALRGKSGICSIKKNNSN